MPRSSTNYCVVARRRGGEQALAVCTHAMHVRSRMTIDHRFRTMPGRSTSDFHRPGRHCLHQARSRAGGWGEAIIYVACLSHLIVDHASPSGQTVPTPNRETSNIWALIRYAFSRVFRIYKTFCL